jgi:Bardet-Biedl syndrome 5 protein
MSTDLKVFEIFKAVVKSYEETKVYRDLKLRCSIVQERRLQMLPREEIFSTYNGVWNLAAEQGSLGTLIITNVRIVWFAQLTENYNASVPWIQVKCLKVRESKYGTALVVETSEFVGGYVLGFRAEKLDSIYTEVSKLFNIYCANPIFGVEMTVEPKTSGELPEMREETVEIVETGYEAGAKAKMRYEVGRKAKTTEGMP